jgi:hypothetical protein
VVTCIDSEWKREADINNGRGRALLVKEWKRKGVVSEINGNLLYINLLYKEWKNLKLDKYVAGSKSAEFHMSITHHFGTHHWLVKSTLKFISSKLFTFFQSK